LHALNSTALTSIKEEIEPVSLWFSSGSQKPGADVLFKYLGVADLAAQMIRETCSVFGMTFIARADVRINRKAGSSLVTL